MMHFCCRLRDHAHLFISGWLLVIGLLLTNITFVDADGTAQLTLTGIGAQPVTLTAADLAKLPRQTITVDGADGKQDSYSGVFLADLLVQQGVKLRQDLKHPDLANYLLAIGGDDYAVVIALPEFDTGRFLIADSENGKPFATSDGPLRLISPDEKRHSRWVKQLQRLELLTAKP